MCDTDRCSYADELLNGWGVRPYTWEASALRQHELRLRIGMAVGYFRTWYGNFPVTDNLFNAAAGWLEQLDDAPHGPRRMKQVECARRWHEGRKPEDLSLSV